MGFTAWIRKWIFGGFVGNLLVLNGYWIEESDGEVLNDVVMEFVDIYYY
jgi:hypothetical protein